MDKYSYISNANPAYIEELFEKYKSNPESVDHKWQTFFEGIEFYESVNKLNPFESNSNQQSSMASSETFSTKEIAVSKLINAYRTRGHLISETNPVRVRRKHKADLSLSYFNLSESDLSTTFEAGKEIGLPNATLKDILNRLKETYCS